MLKFCDYDIVFQEIPNETTLAVNISNCPNRCKACHSVHLQEDIGEELTSEKIIFLMDKYALAITCFCFMGGDIAPFEVLKLAKFIKQNYPKIKTAWYSGCASLPPNFEIKAFDYIKLGEYKENLGSLKEETSNQHLYKILEDGSMEDISCLFRKNREI